MLTDQEPRQTRYTALFEAASLITPFGVPELRAVRRLGSLPNNRWMFIVAGLPSELDLLFRCGLSLVPFAWNYQSPWPELGEVVQSADMVFAPRYAALSGAKQPRLAPLASLWVFIQLVEVFDLSHVKLGPHSYGVALQEASQPMVK